MPRTRICEPLNDATPSRLHHNSKDGWPQAAMANDDRLRSGPLSQNGYLMVRSPHVAGSQTACAWWHRRSNVAKSGKNSNFGFI
ncbi:Os01g0138232 [Oryza sativa Japonica Group]|uniref:Os01g0138232 protein n=1 Tax=Oryza sativa subsp. japonica TaxID=39947 RepID=A0A0P0UYN1_ORYSJ|nr:Os01g0138232 [Oryza sativa Japonica Group]